MCKLVSGQGGEQGREERGENSGQFSAREAGNRRKLREGRGRLPGEEMTAIKTPGTLRLLPAAGGGRTGAGVGTSEAPFCHRGPRWRGEWRHWGCRHPAPACPAAPAGTWVWWGALRPAEVSSLLHRGLGAWNAPALRCEAHTWRGSNIPVSLGGDDGSTVGKGKVSPPGSGPPRAPGAKPSRTAGSTGSVA